MGVLKSCPHAAVNSCSSTPTSQRQSPSSPGAVFGVQVGWGAAAWPGAGAGAGASAGPARLLKRPFVPSGDTKGSSPAGQAGASGGAARAQRRGGPWHLPQSWGVLWAGCAGVLRLQNWWPPYIGAHGLGVPTHGGAHCPTQDPPNTQPAALGLSDLALSQGAPDQSLLVSFLPPAVLLMVGGQTLPPLLSGGCYGKPVGFPW